MQFMDTKKKMVILYVALKINPMQKLLITYSFLFFYAAIMAQTVTLPPYYGANYVTPDSCGNYSVIDFQGNVYNTIKIGNQCWLKQNLKSTKYNDGNNIPNKTTAYDWTYYNTPAYCWYNNNSTTGAIYGALYNFYAIETGKLCPIGWHIPSDSEWQTLEIFLGIDAATANTYGWRGSNQGGELKETGTSHWNAPNTGATNNILFTAFGGGKREMDYSYATAPFSELKQYGYFWTSSIDIGWSYYRKIGFDHSEIGRWEQDKHTGSSVRCVRD
jgi:uncharacterized protein (TIGR02145 family)